MPPARLLDVTRLTARAGLGPTGVDRVERAYLTRLLQGDAPAFGLARTALGFVLLDEGGLRALEHAVRGGDWGGVDLLSRLNPRLTETARLGQSFVRRHAVARCSRAGLSRMLGRIGPHHYYNVGHSNLTARSLSAVPGEVTVLVHDTIPLDWPEHQRAGTVEAFARKLGAVRAHADRLIASTHAVAEDLRRHGLTQPAVVAPLGIERPVPGEVPAGIPLDRPLFVALGTIEPRKNHALLLDVWEGIGDRATLVVAGRRGWNNAEVFARLDRGLPGVIEAPGLTDGEVAALLTRARALLFPSLAEGYGLPPVEALALGTPAIVADLPACREVLGDAAIYADPLGRYQWTEIVETLLRDPGRSGRPTWTPPDWEAHFNAVFTEAG